MKKLWEGKLRGPPEEGGPRAEEEKDKMAKRSPRPQGRKTGRGKSVGNSDSSTEEGGGGDPTRSNNTNKS